MLKTCGAVLDSWKKYVTSANVSNIKINNDTTEECIENLYSRLRASEIPVNCYCPLPCHEIKYDAELFPRDIPNTDRNEICGRVISNERKELMRLNFFRNFI